MSYSFTQLEDLWKQAGGNAAYAAMAAAIALAESGGDPQSTNHNTNGTVDRGLWQINSIHGAQSTYDVMSNARAAVAISNNGSNWKPWCTAWSNGRCGGTFMGSGAPVFKHLPSGAPTGGATGQTPGGSATPAGNAIPGVPDSALTPGLPGLIGGGKDVVAAADLPGTLAAIYNSLTKTLWFGAVSVVGLLMIFAGLALLIYQTKPGAMVAGKLKSAVG